MESLIKLLLQLLQRVPALSEEAHDEELDLLRDVESKLGLSGIVPPKQGPTNAPVAVPVVDPGPVAEPTGEVAPVATFPGIAAPEEANAFT